MDLSSKFLKTRSKKPNFLSKESIARVLTKRNTTIKSPPKLERIDSNSTTINHTKISHTLNSEILYQNLKPPNSKRAESELRQILIKPYIPREKSEELRKKHPLYRNSGILRPTYKLNDSNWRNKNLDSSSFLKPSKPFKMRDSFKRSSIIINKNQVELVPIFFDVSPKDKEKKFSSGKKGWKKAENQEMSQFLIFAQDNSHGNSPEIAKTLKSISKDVVEDWKKSLLYHNLKNNRGSPEVFHGYYRRELEELVNDFPKDSKTLQVVLEKLFCTLEKLLIQLLGTQEDFENFKKLCSVGSESLVRFLAEKCLSLYVFRDKTSWIIENILKREQVMKEIRCGNIKYSIEIFSVSNKIRNYIENWLEDPCAPFKQFIYDGEDYLERIERDIKYLDEYGLS